MVEGERFESFGNHANRVIWKFSKSGRLKLATWGPNNKFGDTI